MNSIQEIEVAIMRLSKVEARKLSNWLQEYLDDAWDRQIEEDAKSGRLDKLIQRANADITSDRVKPLDEVLNNL